MPSPTIQPAEKMSVNYKRRLARSLFVLAYSGKAFGFCHPSSQVLFPSRSKRTRHGNWSAVLRGNRFVDNGLRRLLTIRRGEAGRTNPEYSLPSPLPPSHHSSSSTRRPSGLVSLISRAVRSARRSSGPPQQQAPPNPENGAASSGGSPNRQRDELERLRRENILLRETVIKLEAENEKLQQDFANRIVIETFEGEGKIRKAREEALEEEDGDDEDASFMLMSEEQMLYDDPAQWCDELEDGACPVEPAISFGEALRDRAYWLVGLLVMQSLSGVILARNEALLANHPVIVYFLTMLVGAGGNAGNQASVRVIRGLALGTLNEETQAQFLTRELKMAVSLSTILSIAGFLRAAVFHTPLPETIAVTAALAMIVFSSICLGAILPLVLKRMGVDPAHSSTTIQVVMDILGVILAVLVSNSLLDSPLGQLIVSRLSWL